MSKSASLSIRKLVSASRPVASPARSRSISTTVTSRQNAVQLPSTCTFSTSSRLRVGPHYETANQHRAYSQSHRASTKEEPPRRSLPVKAALIGSLVPLAAYYSYGYLVSDPESSQTVLAPDRWTRVEIESVDKLTQDTSLFRIRVPKTVLPPSWATLIDNHGDHGNGRVDVPTQVQPILSLFVKEPTLQIQRAYTPLSAKSFNRDGSATLELVVKRYRDGEVSRYLHRLGPGDHVEIRAPSLTWVYKPQDWDRVVFIAGGTGVTPAFQCMNDSVSSALSTSRASTSAQSNSPTLSLIYASSSPSETFLRPQLDHLLETQGGTSPISKIQYHVDRLDPSNRLPERTKLGLIDKKSLELFLGRKNPNERVAIVVCGPEGMINAIAGPRGRNFSQGPVGGILKQLGYSEKDVVKL